MPRSSIWWPVLKLKPAQFPTLLSQPGTINDGSLTNEPDGHRVETSNRGRGENGVMTTLVPPPVTGTFQSIELYHTASFLFADRHARPPGRSPLRGSSRSGSPHPSRSDSPFPRRSPIIPRLKMDFPQFWGERPCSWKRNCESYFWVFHLDPEMWVDTAACISPKPP